MSKTKDLRPHRTALSSAVDGRPYSVVYPGDPWNTPLLCYRDNGETLAQAEALREEAVAAFDDRQTWAGKVWVLRESEQDTRQEDRALYVKNYRPLQTLDGLDPLWEFSRAFRALGRGSW